MQVLAEWRINERQGCIKRRETDELNTYAQMTSFRSHPVGFI